MTSSAATAAADTCNIIPPTDATNGDIAQLADAMGMGAVCKNVAASVTANASVAFASASATGMLNVLFVWPQTASSSGRLRLLGL